MVEAAGCHNEARAVVQEQIDEWLELFDDNMEPKPGVTVPPQVQRWKEAMEREQRAAAWIQRWGASLKAMAAVGIAVCAASVLRVTYGSTPSHSV
eukprot:COSAG01_NODE_48_length_31904_cov_21.696997_31_plen_95_part_00